MHRIGQKTTLQERVTIGKQATAGRTDAQIAANHMKAAQRLRRRGAAYDPYRTGKLGKQAAPAHHHLMRCNSQVEPDCRRRRGRRWSWLADDTNIEDRHLNWHAARDADLGVQHIDFAADRELAERLATQAQIGIESRCQKIARQRAGIVRSNFEIDRQPSPRQIDRARDP